MGRRIYIKELLMILAIKPVDVSDLLSVNWSKRKRFLEVILAAVTDFLQI